MKLQSTHEPQRTSEANDYVIAKTFFLCQIKSEFHPLKKGHISKKLFLAGKYADFGHFRKMLITSDFRFLYISLTCQSYAFTLQELCFELVRCGI